MTTHLTSVHYKTIMNGVPAKMVVTFYTKPGCHLCDNAYLQLESLKQDTEFEIEVVDIRSTDELYAEFRATIPAIKVGDAVFIEGPFAQDVLEEIRREVIKDNANPH